MQLRAVAVYCCVLTTVPTAKASYGMQVSWERVGSAASDVHQRAVDGIAFDRWSAEFDDTLYTTLSYGVFRFPPGGSDWEVVCEMSICRTTFIEVTREGNLLIGGPQGPGAGAQLSADGGITWEQDVIGYGETVLLQSTLPSLGGALFAGNANSVSWSLEGGLRGSWILGEPMGGEPIDLVEVLPSASLPEGRLVGGVWNGAVYSDSGGQTWSPSGLQGTNHVAVNSLTFSPDASHPYAGVVYAGVRDFAVGYPAVYRSDDGGVNWTLVRGFPPGDYDVEDPNWVVVQAGPGKSLYVAVQDVIPGANPSVGTVVSTFDGGTTWSEVADSTNGWGGHGVNALLMGRDGHLYAATDRGVWRTVDPVPVANEPEPAVPDETGALLEVAPNPFREETTVILTLGEPANVRMSVFDILGREVAVLADRNYPTGSHEIKTDVARLPVGVLFVRAVLAPTLGTGSVGPASLTTQFVKLR